MSGPIGRELSRFYLLKAPASLPFAFCDPQRLLYGIGLRTSRRKSPQWITALGRTPPALLALTQGFPQPLHELTSLPSEFRRRH